MMNFRWILLCVVCIVLVVPVSIVFGQFNDDTQSTEDKVTKMGSMTIGQAAILGVIEGVTEYLPVSSTGHLLVAQRVMGINGSEETKAAADAYAICIQAGAIAAVFGLYWHRVRQMVAGVVGRDSDGRRLAINVIAGFIPAVVIGLALNDLIKDYLFGMWPIVVAWFVGGVAILAVAWRRRSSDGCRTVITIEQLTWRLALIIGFLQCIAMWPGVSRSLVTIVGGVIVGLSLPAAVEFSFLLGLVTLGAATCYDGFKHGQLMLDMYGPFSLIVGGVVAMISAALAVKWMVGYLNKHGLAIFGYYRVAIAIIVGVLLWLSIL